MPATLWPPLRRSSGLLRLKRFFYAIKCCFQAVPGKKWACREAQASLFKLRFSGSFVFSTASVSCCRYLCLLLIESPLQLMNGAVSLDGTFVWCERWRVRALSYCAVPDSRSDARLLWPSQVGKTLECRGLSHNWPRMCLTSIPWVLNTVQDCVQRLGC